MAGERWRKCSLIEAIEVNPQRPIPKNAVVPYIDMASLPTIGWKISALSNRAHSSGGAKFQNGDTLFARITPCAENGKTGMVDCLAPGQIGLGSTEFIVLAPREGITESQFVFYLAKSPIIRDYAIAQMEGTSGRRRVPTRVFSEISLPLPPLPEQRKIAAILTSVDDAIEKSSAVIDQLEVVKKALMQELLTRGLPGRHTRFKQTEIGEIPELFGEFRNEIASRWTTLPLKEIATLQRGFDLPVQHRELGSIPVIASNGPVGWHSQARVKGPGVVTGRSGTIGKVFFYRGDFWPLNTSLFVTDFHGNDPLFVSYLLSNLRLDRFAESTGVPTLNRNTIHPIQISIPDPPEQRLIAEILSSLDATIEKSRVSLKQTESAKQALLSTLLSGEVRVPLDKDAA